MQTLNSISCFLFEEFPPFLASDRLNNARLWSLLRIMRDFDFGHFCWALSLLEEIESLTIHNQAAGSENLLREHAIGLMTAAVDKLGEVCGSIDFRETQKQGELLLQHFRDPFGDRSSSVAITRMRVLKEILFSELNGRKFLWIAPDHSLLVDQDQLFGQQVWENFPSARRDIKEAGNCIAADCNTACGFPFDACCRMGIKDLLRGFRA